jgi:hypothetical protein
MKEGYYPQWYLENLSCIYKKNILRTIIYFSIFFIFIFMGIVGNYNKKLNIIDKIQGNKAIDLTINEKNITTFIYNYIYEVILKEELNIITINIDKDNVMFNVKVTGKEDYSMAIKILEEKFSIIEISSMLQEGEELYFRAKVKINGY